MKYMFMEEAGEKVAAGGAKDSGPDVAKVLQDGFKSLQADINKLNSRIDQKLNAPAPKPQKQEEEEDLSTTILVDPAKAVSRLTSQITEKVMGAMSNQNSKRDSFQSKFAQLQADYPEVANSSSELHTRAKELMAESEAGEYDSAALERAVLRAASEKGIMAMKHRKVDKTEDNDDYMGGGGSSGSSPSERKNKRSGKLDPKTVAFASLVGVNVKDPKVLERLTNIQNERAGNWNKYK